MSTAKKDTNVTTRSKPPSGTKTPTEMKPSKAESLALAAQKKGALLGRPLNSSPLGKSAYLSKSSENLTTHQKKKLALEGLRPKSSLGLPNMDITKKKASNKENLQVSDKSKEGFQKPKPVKPSLTSTPVLIRKASSSQHIDKSGSSPAFKVPSSTKVNMKRAHSTQNVSKDKATRKRTSATSDVMAYNAELLANFEKEKKSLEAKLSEHIQIAEDRKFEIEKIKYEIKNLKTQIPSHDIKEEVEILRVQNKELQDQLIKLGFPVDQHITDAEKLSQLQQRESEISMKASASCDSLSTEGRAVSMTAAVAGILGPGMKRSASVTMSEPGISLTDFCHTPEHPSLLSSLDIHHKWDSRSKSSDALSDVSVANLTERIIQMEETHYSTNEELQATLQELGDLQDAVNELTEENERLADERSVLLESLCTQTEKLEHCRTQIEQLKCLLISGDLPNKSDRDQHLLGLLKGAQEEREEMVRKQVELANALHKRENENKEYQEHAEIVKDKLQSQEDKVTAVRSEKEALEKLVIEFKESLANEQIEVNHYKTLLENEKTKVQELESLCKAAEKSDLEELLHNARQEKDKLEEKLANAQDALAHSQNEITRLRESMLSKEEELRVSRNNSKTQLSDMEYKIEKIKKEKYDIQQEKDALREHVDQLEQDCDRYLDEKKNFAARIQELQGDISVMRQLKEVAEIELQDTKLKHSAELEEWKQFQKDLQVAVVIANEFRSETQTDVEKLKSDNTSLQEKCNSLLEETSRLRTELDQCKIQERATTFNSSKSSILSSAELKGKVISTVDKELAHLRDGKKLGFGDKAQTLSVKNLIRSIEEQVKSGCSSIHSSSCSSRRNSDSETSLAGIRDFQEILKSPSSPVTEQGFLSPENGSTPLRSVLKRSNDRPSPLQRHSMSGLEAPVSPGGESPKSAPPLSRNDTPPSLTSILSSRTPSRRSSGVNQEPSSERKEGAGKDPLSGLAKSFKGSKRNALLKWCQQKTITYSEVDITNFSSSWNDGLAFCALLHSYVPEKIPYGELNTEDKRRNFTLAFNAADSVGIPSILNINDMVAMERPDWQAVFSYVTSIYKHFEVDNKTP